MSDAEGQGGPAPANLPASGGESVVAVDEYSGLETSQYPTSGLLEIDPETGHPPHNEVYFRTAMNRFAICPRSAVDAEPVEGSQYVMVDWNGSRSAGRVQYFDLWDDVLRSTVIREGAPFNLRNPADPDRHVIIGNVANRITAVNTNDWLDDFDLEEFRPSTARSDFWTELEDAWRQDDVDQPPLDLVAPGFTPLGVETGHTDPYGETHNEAWWYRARPERVEWQGDPGILGQSTWAESDNSSCYLTTMLNGWVARGELTQDEAAEIQDTLVYDERYRDDAAYWVSTPDNPEFREFAAWPNTAAFAAREITGRRMPLDVEQVSAAEAPGRLNDLLDEGYILGVGSGGHWVTVLRPRDMSSEHALLINPMGPNITTIDAQAVAALHNPERSVVMM